jgi:FG-GAP repeat
VAGRCFSAVALGSALLAAAYGGSASSPTDHGLTRTDAVVQPVLSAVLHGADTVAGDGFGTALAVSDGTVVVGAQDHDRRAGRVYVFTRTESGWRQTAELVGSDTRTGDGFGQAVAVSAKAIIVGDPGFGGNASRAGTGRAYVFTRTGLRWRQAAELRAPSGYPGDDFGVAVALSGNTVVIGEDGFDRSEGRALVYELGRRGCRLTAQLRASGRGVNQVPAFGSVLAISGSEAIVGAPSGGAAVIFHRAAFEWHQAAFLSEPPLPQGDDFGASVAITGNTAAVGAEFGNRIFLYTRASSGWKQSAQLQDPRHQVFVPGGPSDLFGGATGLGATVLIAGAAGSGKTRTGAAYLFVKSATGWRLKAGLRGMHLPSGALGTTAAVWDDTAAVTATGIGPVLGEVYIFRI